MQVGPQDTTIHMLNGLEQMMMVGPIDSQEYKTDQIAEQDRNQRSKPMNRGVVRRPKLEHHDRYQDSDHSIAKCFHSRGGHIRFVSIFFELSRRDSMMNVRTCLLYTSPSPRDS